MIDNNIIIQKEHPYKCLIHLDRLSLTLIHHTGSTFQDIRNPNNIPEEQIFDNVILYHNLKKGNFAYYHCFNVHYKGILVGELYSGRKLKKHELQLDFNKQLFYLFPSLENHTTISLQKYTTLMQG